MLRYALITCLSSAMLLALVGGCRGSEKYPAELDAARRSKACLDGMAQAKADIERHHLELRSAGLAAPYMQVYTQLLEERLGVHHRLTGCSITPTSIARDDAYNSVMTAEIERRHGTGVLDLLRGEAKAKWHASTTRPAI